MSFVPTSTPTLSTSPTLLPSPTSTLEAQPATVTPTPEPTQAVTICREAVINGDFERGIADWVQDENPIPPRLTADRAYRGQLSLLLGLRPGDPDLVTDSSVRQLFYVPESATSVMLSFWYWPATEDRDRLGEDRQQALLYVGGFNSLDLHTEILNNIADSRTWTRLTLNSLDIDSLRGEIVTLFFNVANNGNGDGRTWIYLDDVSFQICEPSPID